MKNVGLFLAAEQRRLRGTEERRKRRDCYRDGFVLRATDGASDPVQEGAGRFFADWRGDIFEAGGDNVFRQYPGYFFIVFIFRGRRWTRAERPRRWNQPAPKRR